MKVCYIFSGGIMNDGDLTAFELPAADFVICADAGYVYAKKYGFAPDILVGDFDSLKDVPVSDGFPTEKFPSEKDDTDTMLAIRKALEENADEIIIFGALGGRADHAFANIQSLNFIAEHGKQGIIVSENEYITIVRPGEYSFKCKENFSFSMFAFSEKVENIYSSGLKYPLSGGCLNYSFPVGVCNEVINDTAAVSFKKGRLLVMISKKSNHFPENE